MREWVRKAAPTEVLRGALAGMAGGLIGSFAMKFYMDAVSRAQPISNTSASDPQGDDVTSKVADKALRKITGQAPSRSAKQAGSTAIHYGFGTLVGGIYGASTEVLPWATLGLGGLFASAVFLGADELSLPALKLAKRPEEESASVQFQHWASHLVYGVATEVVCRGIRGR